MGLISLEAHTGTSGVRSSPLQFSLWILSALRAGQCWSTPTPSTCSLTPHNSSSPDGLHSFLPIRGVQLNSVVNARVFLCVREYNLASQISAYGILKCAIELTESKPFQAAESAKVKADVFLKPLDPG